jgi:MoxR-like ATPase
MEQHGVHQPTRAKVALLRAELDRGLEGVELKAVEKRLSAVKALLEQLLRKHELSGPVYEDVIHLKSLYSRYNNYAHWLKQSAAR